MIAFDTNVLIYAEDASDRGERHARAAALLARLANTGAIIPVQVLCEFVNVCRNKAVVPLDLAVGKVGNYQLLFETPPTEVADVQKAALVAVRYKLQFFDALIVTVAARFGADALLSEDMQDGLEIEGLRIINPFNPANREAVDRLLAIEP